MAENQAAVAVFLPSLVGGGAERVMLNLACGFVRRGVPVDLVLAAAEGPYLNEVPAEIRIVDLAAGRIRSSIFPLIRYLRREAPAVLLSALDHANCAAVLARDLSRSRTQVVVTLHSTPSENTGHRTRYRALLAQTLLRYTHARADTIVAVSAGVAADYVALYNSPADKIKVVYNPVISADLFIKADQPLEHPWFAEGQPPVLLAVGRLTEQKDFVNLIEAFARVKAAGLPCRLMILGEGELRELLEGLVCQHGLQAEIALPGFVKNPFPYLAKARLFVLSSRCEGLPTVLIEALAVGTPVVATNCRSGPVEILDNGRFGTLVPIKNAAALADAICAELAREKQRPRKEAWERFSVEQALDGYLRLLRPGKSGLGAMSTQEL